MDHSTINDALVVIYIFINIVALVFAVRIIFIEVIPGLSGLRHLSADKKIGPAQLLLGQAGAFLERIKLFMRGFAAVWALGIVLISMLLPTIFITATGGWAETVDFFRAMPSGALLMLVISLLPAVVIYLLPDWIERRVRQYLERHGQKVRDTLRKHQAYPAEKINWPPKIEK